MVLDNENNFSYIKEKRVKSNFQYDALLGINAGGGVSFGDNETYTMDVKIVGVGNIAEYAQTHRGSNPTTNASNKSNWEFKPYDIEQFAKNPDNLGMVLYMQMYNQLPLAKKNEADAAKRGSMVSSGDRSAKIRTYNYPQGRVTDHRIGLTLYDLSNIVNGDIQKIIDELMLAENTEKLKELGDSI